MAKTEECVTANDSAATTAQSFWSVRSIRLGQRKTPKLDLHDEIMNTNS
jgi:hypothetical protein